MSFAGVCSAETAGDIEEVDVSLCVQWALFSSPEAAHGWLAAHPGAGLSPQGGVGSKLPPGLAG